MNEELEKLKLENNKLKLEVIAQQRDIAILKHKIVERDIKYEQLNLKIKRSSVDNHQKQYELALEAFKQLKGEEDGHDVGETE